MVSDHDLRAACYHEAAHVVFIYHAGFTGLTVRYVSIKSAERPDLSSVCSIEKTGRPTRSQILCRGLAALAGLYAQGRVQGESFEIESFEDFSEHAESEDSCEDCKEALKMIRLSAKDAEDPEDVAEKLYMESCRQVAAHVEEFWSEIEAVAGRLLEAGSLEGEEVSRIIQGVREPSPHV